MNAPSDHQPTKETVRQTSLQFHRDFELSQTEELVSFQALQEKIASVIGQLLRNNPERLLNLMYRLDIDENKFRFVIQNGPEENVAQQLAELVLEREMQKVYWRNKYRE
jgi:hypothetical protein